MMRSMQSDINDRPSGAHDAPGEFIARMALVFPFAIVIDDTFKITASGHLLQKVLPAVTAYPSLDLCFSCAQFDGRSACFAELAAREGELMVLHSAPAAQSLPPLRGQWLRVGERELMFLGWPWVTSFGQLAAMGVTLSDIPPHHALAEMLMLLQTNRNAMDDARELASKIKQRNQELEQLTKELRHQAYHDALTGLPNRLMFRERLSHAIARARRQQSFLAVLFIDLDRFKAVNDSLGHRVGDLLLQAVAARLRSGLRETDTVAREAGDEFVVLIEDVAEAAHVARVAAKVLDLMNKVYLIEGHELHCGASIGVSLFPGDGTDEDQLINHADAAMFDSKGEGRNRVRFFSEESWQRITHRFETERELRSALHQQQFVVYYQPQVNLAGHSIRSAEALLRWQHPLRGLVQPGEFIPLAEESGLIVQIGDWVLDRVCGQIAAWREQQGWSPSVSVNISARHLQLPGFAQRVEAVLARWKIPPELLELELTEHSLMQHHRQVSELLAHLKERGVKLVLDDFGTGYSNLMTLANLPFDKLKVDRAFIAGLSDSAQSRALVNMIITLARQLELKVVAEGVETYQQQNLLAGLGCECVQGYLHAPPLTVEQFEQLAFGSDLDRHPARRA